MQLYAQNACRMLPLLHLERATISLRCGSNFRRTFPYFLEIGQLFLFLEIGKFSPTFLEIAEQDSFSHFLGFVHPIVPAFLRSDVSH